jgi:hypothetical protein
MRNILGTLGGLAVFASLSAVSSGFQHGTHSTDQRALRFSPESYAKVPRITPFSSSQENYSVYRTSSLFQSSPSASNNGSKSPDPPAKGPRKKAARMLRRLLSFRSRVYTRFQALPRKAKRVVLVQWAILLFMFGAVGRNVYSVRGPAPAVEIPYSRFLDLVEQQQSTEAGVPIMNQVRISTDRIIYRLYPNNPSPAETEATEPVPEFDGKAAKRLAKPRRFLVQRKRTKKVQPFVTAYTRKVPASPELVSIFRQSDVHFTAAPQTRSSTAAIVLRSAMAAFYFLILYRLYSSVSNAGGGQGKKDVPGKLAQASDLPLANFDEIQGMDDVKAEVMELVDTIRNPEKYAILGARAPTGLLLEGPPGTGKWRCVVGGCSGGLLRLGKHVGHTASETHELILDAVEEHTGT